MSSILQCLSNYDFLNVQTYSEISKVDVFQLYSFSGTL